MISRARTALLLASLTSACTVATMKPPPGVATSQALPVQGHSGNMQTFKEKDLKIGSYAVTNIDRDWDKGTQVSAGPWSRDAKKKAYRYDVKANQRTLRGECTEQAVQHSVVGFGKMKVTFHCTCKEGDTQRATLDLVNEAGTVKIGEATSFDVTAVHQSEQGAQLSSALGYHFVAADQEGAVDVGGKGRAWAPANMAEEDLFGLVCSYAGLFLYRPTE